MDASHLVPLRHKTTVTSRLSLWNIQQRHNGAAPAPASTRSRPSGRTSAIVPRHAEPSGRETMQARCVSGVSIQDEGAGRSAWHSPGSDTLFTVSVAATHPERPVRAGAAQRDVLRHSEKKD